jgi:hypothetical protein
MADASRHAVAAILGAAKRKSRLPTEVIQSDDQALRRPVPGFVSASRNESVFLTTLRRRRPERQVHLVARRVSSVRVTNSSQSPIHFEPRSADILGPTSDPTLHPSVLLRAQISCNRFIEPAEIAVEAIGITWTEDKLKQYIERPHEIKPSDAKSRRVSAPDPRLQMWLRMLKAALVDERFQPHVTIHNKVPRHK